MIYSRHHRSGLAKISPEADNLQLRAILGISAQHFHRAVAAPIVHANDFEWAAKRVENREKTLAKVGNAVFLIIDRNDDGEIGQRTVASVSSLFACHGIQRIFIAHRRADPVLSYFCIHQNVCGFIPYPLSSVNGMGVLSS